MGMTTKELIEFYENCPFNVKGSVVNEYTIPALKKVDKIEQILKEWESSGLLQNQLYDKIKEVFDGNDD
jgi:hypothetical protein